MNVQMSEGTFNLLAGMLTNANIQIPLSDAESAGVAQAEFRAAAQAHNEWLQSEGVETEQQYFEKMAAAEEEKKKPAPKKPRAKRPSKKRGK